MDLQQYLQYMDAHKNWSPGGDAIMDAFDLVYGKAAGQYFEACRVTTRPTPLEGFGVYAAGGWMHIVTRGLSQTAPAPDAFAATRSGWGFELTAKCPGKSVLDCRTALLLLNRLACYADVRKTGFRSYVSFPITARLGLTASRTESLAAVAFVPDEDISSVDTIHGRVDFLQVVNLTQTEWRQIRQHQGLIRQLLFNMQHESPHCFIDVERVHSYL